MDQCHELLKARSYNMAKGTLSESQQMKRERGKIAPLPRQKGLASLGRMVSFETIDEFVIEERDLPSTASSDSLAPKDSHSFSCSKSRNSVLGNIYICPNKEMGIGSGTSTEATFVCPNETCNKRYRHSESLYRHVRQKHLPKNVKDAKQQEAIITGYKGTNLPVINCCKIWVQT